MIYFFSLYLLLELIFFLLISYLQIRIPWIITDKNEYPDFKKEKIKNFIKKTYDYDLGWNWKPKTTHREKIFNQINKIVFGSFGERANFNKTKKKNSFASFGDSFVFCRYVKNHETWQEQLNKLSNFKGLNLGVGNYGLDQIYLKYKKTKLPKNIKIIFIGFVPETLSRCLCLWKHYHEFNNIYAFKPKFSIYKNKIKLIKNPIKDRESFKNIKKVIKDLKKKEFFYKEKFSKNKLNFPYFLSSLKNLKYNVRLIYFSTLKVLRINNDKIFEFIIKNNCIKNDIYFANKGNKKLIENLMLKINNLSKSRNQKIFFLIFPQKYDLFLKYQNYDKFFQMQKDKFEIIDFTKIFKKKDINKIYLPDQYGGHLTPFGNKIVAETLSKKIYSMKFN